MILEGEYVEGDYKDVAYVIDVGLLNENPAYQQLSIPTHGSTYF